MKAKIIEKFEVMTSRELAIVEGGSKVGAGEFFHALAVCTTSGAATGSVFPVVGTLGGRHFRSTILYWNMGND